MGLDVSLGNVNYDLQQLQQRPVVNPEDAERALEVLEGISDRILVVIDKVNTPLAPRDQAFMENMAFTVAVLQNRFIMNSRIRSLCEKMKKVSRKEKISKPGAAKRDW